MCIIDRYFIYVCYLYYLNFWCAKITHCYVTITIFLSLFFNFCDSENVSGDSEIFDILMVYCINQCCFKSI